MPQPGSTACSLGLAEDGAQLYSAALVQALPVIEQALAGVPVDQAGIRLRGVSVLNPLLASSGPLGALVTPILGPTCRPVRAILFDKSNSNNWALPWHQDRTIAVVERREVEGFGPWTVKAGMQHVAPPQDLLAKMITVRAHLDEVPASNAPLLVAPGSHRMGRIAEADIADVVRRCGIATCLAEPGDVWVYSTLMLHASKAASAPSRRRVLQVDYAAEELPGGLEWLGV